MESIFSRYKNALVLMVVLLAQVVLLAMQVRRPAPGLPDGHNVRLWRYLIASVVTPPERLAHNIGFGVRGAWSNYIYLRNLREQNQKLEAENDRLHLEQASLVEDAREGQRLREMLDFKGRYIDKTVAAQVIGTSGTDQAHVIYIDKGSNDGLRVQMPVITPDGIVGKVKNVFPGTAQVLLISDQTSGAGVMLESTRIRGVMKGNASGEPQLINISPDDRIKPGEPVLSSGGDQVYPRGLPVGEVERVVADPDTSYVNVIVKPYANLAKLEEVLVITEISDKMPFTQQKDILQSEVDALAEKQRAADILSEKLPSLEQVDAPTAPGAGDASDGVAAASSDPARPMRPPAALHPDRYTPGAAPPAASLTPGAAPAGLHRDTAPSASTSAPNRTSRPAGAAATGNESAPLNRFPPRSLAVAPVTAASPVDKPGTAVGAVSSAKPTPASPAGGIPAPKTVVRPPANGGLGFKLPMQPADSTTPRRLISPGTTSLTPGAVAAQPATRVPRPVAVPPTSGGVPGSAAGATATRTPRTVVPGTAPATAPGATPKALVPNAGTPRVANPGTANPGVTSPKITRPGVSNSGLTGPGAVPATRPSAANSLAPTVRPPVVPGATGTATTPRPTAVPRAGTPANRRIVIPSESGSGGILTPAGMGQVGVRPRPATPAAAANGAARPGASGNTPGVMPNTPRAQTAPGTAKPPSTKPPARPPASTTVPPAKPAAQPPPSGGR